MADARKYAQAQKFTLAVGISTTDTSITLQSFNFPNGTAIASGDLGTINYGTLEPGTSREESISFTGITSNADGTVTLTGVTRGLGFGAVDNYSEQSDLKSQHGTGAIFILSNTAAFYNDFVNKYNDEEMSGMLTVQTPTASGHAANKQYVDDMVNGGAVSNDRIVQAGTAGESVAEGDLVYFDDTDNEWKKCDATTASTVNNVLIGIAQGSGSNGGAIDGGVLTYGLDSTQTGLTPGVKLYASDTAGAIAESAGTVERVIGWSKSATEIYFDANVEYTPTADEKAAMAGGGDFGTPGSTNKFVTEDYLTRAVSTTYNLADSPATFTKKNGLRFVRVQVWGGGGSGGASSTENGSGGGGGSYLEGFFDASELGATETITIGAGGAAISGTSNGNNGGDTSFGSLLVAYGGKGGLQGNTNIAGGNGGHVGVSSITSQYGIAVSGQAGADGKLWGGAAGGGIDESGAGGLVGGSSVFGGAGGGGTENLDGGAAAGGTSVFGGNGGAAAQSTNATAGSVPGGGGGGAHAGNSGAGGAGRCIVTEYYS